MSLLLPLLAAAAQPVPATAADIRCAAIFAYTAGSSKPEEQAGLIGGFLYFLGKIDGRSPETDLERALVDLLSTKDFETAVLAPDGKRCGSELESRGGELEKIGKALDTKGK